MEQVDIGIVGGSGLYELAGLEDVREVRMDTPFGPPSGPVQVGTLSGKAVCFLARHGPGHVLSPSEINFRANIFAFKLLGVTRLLSVSAVGSMREQVAPMDLVVPDQFIDRTRHRADSFFGEGLVVHVPFSDPVCPELASRLAVAAEEGPARVHRGGTYLSMEGPAFSTRAESNLYRTWDVTVIGMTNLQEAKLAREAEICYATLALVTDYDCWHESEADVDVEAVLGNLRQNAGNAAATLRRCVASLVDRCAFSCACSRALEGAILTAPDRIPEATRRRLSPIIGHRLPS